MLHILCDGNFELAYFKTYIYFGFAVEVKVKIALYLIEYHHKQSYGLVKVQNHAFFTLVQCDVNERPHARPLHFCIYSMEPTVG
jgi:uncharacterized membrane protein (Fun14 family)